jgi:nucleoside-diphosphate-sugar epimerase
MGTRLIPRLLARGWEVCAVVRPGSEGKIPAGCELVRADALCPDTYREHIAPGDIFVHLVGLRTRVRRKPLSSRRSITPLPRGRLRRRVR